MQCNYAGFFISTVVGLLKNEVYARGIRRNRKSNMITVDHHYVQSRKYVCSCRTFYAFINLVLLLLNDLILKISANN